LGCSTCRVCCNRRQHRHPTSGLPSLSKSRYTKVAIPGQVHAVNKSTGQWKLDIDQVSSDNRRAALSRVIFLEIASSLSIRPPRPHPSTDAPLHRTIPVGPCTSRTRKKCPQPSSCHANRLCKVHRTLQAAHQLAFPMYIFPDHYNYTSLRQ